MGGSIHSTTLILEFLNERFFFVCKIEIKDLKIRFLIIHFMGLRDNDHITFDLIT